MPAIRLGTTTVGGAVLRCERSREGSDEGRQGRAVSIWSAARRSSPTRLAFPRASDRGVRGAEQQRGRGDDKRSAGRSVPRAGRPPVANGTVGVERRSIKASSEGPALGGDAAEQGELVAPLLLNSCSFTLSSTRYLICQEARLHVYVWCCGFYPWEGVLVCALNAQSTASDAVV